MSKILRYATLLVCLSFTAYPLVWMTLASFRTDADVLEHPFALPEQWLGRNFIQVFQNGGFRSPTANALLLLAAFAVAAVAFCWMLDMLQFRCRLWHLLFYAAIAATFEIVLRNPDLKRALTTRPGFANAYVNSLCVSVVAVTSAIMLAAMAAFAFSRLHFKGQKLFFLLFLLGMTIPVHVTLIPLNLFLGPNFLNLKGSLLALVGPYVGFALPISILILKNAFNAVPKDLIDAARIDGCNAWQIFRFVALPLAKPALATLLIFNFLTTWNEFAFALTLADSRQPTLPVALNNFKGEHGSLDVPVICAALVVAVAPLLFVYVIAQKHVIKGLTAGAVKE